MNKNYRKYVFLLCNNIWFLHFLGEKSLYELENYDQQRNKYSTLESYKPQLAEDYKA